MVDRQRREGAAGRPDQELDEPTVALTHRIFETTMARAWLDFALREYGAHVVLANVPETLWFPPAQDGSLPGILVARSSGDAVRKLATLQPLHQEIEGGR